MSTLTIRWPFFQLKPRISSPNTHQIVGFKDLLQSVFYVLSAYDNHFSQKNYLTMLKFGLMLITTLALWTSILHNIFSIPSCSEFQTVLFYNRNHMIWSSFEQDTVKKTHISILLVVTSTYHNWLCRLAYIWTWWGCSFTISDCRWVCHRWIAFNYYLPYYGLSIYFEGVEPQRVYWSLSLAPMWHLLIYCTWFVPFITDSPHTCLQRFLQAKGLLLQFQ